MNRLLLILAVVLAQLLAGPTSRVRVGPESAGRPTLSREHGVGRRLDARVAVARISIVHVVRARARTRVQRTNPMASVGPQGAPRFASIVATRPTTEGTINPERFVALGLPDTRAP
ncbi:MAG: hypothetical protein ABI664_15265 [bacterium]